ncbi:MAG: hypothetical protein AB8H47_04550 [Bacteroidia bacterium]
MKKRIKIELCKSPLDFQARKAILEVYKAAKGGEQTYFQERLLDYPYYVRFWEQNKLIGFKGIELGRSTNTKSLVIELGQSFLLPPYDEKPLIPRMTLKILWAFWREQLITLDWSLLKGTKFENDHRTKKSRSLFKTLLLLSKEQPYSALHYYRENTPGLASKALEKTARLNLRSGFSLQFVQFKQACKAAIHWHTFQNKDISLKDNFLAEYLQA